ncbi:MAG: hypothetical protein IKI34_02240 [Eubacterium sp.]|nr:hypothetical protein [Eubacterium sp.]
MKKAISILLALVIMAIPFSAFAEGTGSTEIIEHQYSTYTITIPETINTNEAPNIPITLSNANIEQGYKVVVSALNLSDGAVAIYNQNDTTITKYVTLIDSETQQKYPME